MVSLTLGVAVPVRDPFYTSSAWRKLRRRILARDGYECQIRLPVCVTYATQVDHIVSRVEAPDLAMEPQNLRAACGPCNLQLGGRVGASRVRRASGRHRRVIGSGYGDW